MKGVYAEIQYPHYIQQAKPMSRNEIRRFEREKDKIVEALFMIEAKFIANIFDENAPDYVSLYKFYLSMYNSTIDALKKTNVFMFAVPNVLYFANEFKPIEK